MGASEMQMREMYARGTLDDISMLIINVSLCRNSQRGQSVGARGGTAIPRVVKFNCTMRMTRGETLSNITFMRLRKKKLRGL